MDAGQFRTIGGSPAAIQPQLSRPIPEPSPSHRNGSGAKVKLLAPGEKVVTQRRQVLQQVPARRSRVGGVGAAAATPRSTQPVSVAERGAGARQQRPQPVGERGVQAVDVGAVGDPVVAVRSPRARRVDQPVVDVGVGADRQQGVQRAVQRDQRLADPARSAATDRTASLTACGREA